LGNLQCTFRQSSVHIRGTFREYSGNVQCTFGERSVHIRGTFSAHLGNVQCTFEERSMHCDVYVRNTSYATALILLLLLPFQQW
jgi:hypothetical protein